MMNAFTPADPNHWDNEINEQVIPPKVWRKLLEACRRARTAQFHRGRFAEKFMDYLIGVADMSGMDREDLLERVKELA